MVDDALPAGRELEQAVHRVAGILRDLPSRWDGQRVLIIGHVATRLAFDHYLSGVPLEDLIEAEFSWREGWEYKLDASFRA